MMGGCGLRLIHSYLKSCAHLYLIPLIVMVGSVLVVQDLYNPELKRKHRVRLKRGQKVN
jgi:hypothetical protein